MRSDLTRDRALWIIYRYRQLRGMRHSEAQDKVFASPVWRRMRHSLALDAYQLLNGLNLDRYDELDFIAAYRCQRLANACRSLLTNDEYHLLTEPWAWVPDVAVS